MFDRTMLVQLSTADEMASYSETTHADPDGVETAAADLAVDAVGAGVTTGTAVEGVADVDNDRVVLLSVLWDAGGVAVGTYGVLVTAGLGKPDEA